MIFGRKSNNRKISRACLCEELSSCHVVATINRITVALPKTRKVKMGLTAIISDQILTSTSKTVSHKGILMYLGAVAFILEWEQDFNRAKILRLPSKVKILARSFFRNYQLHRRNATLVHRSIVSVRLRI